MIYKKAQGLSITTIVVAALALIVLVVLTIVFTGSINPFAQRATDCASLGGQCVPKSAAIDTGALACPAASQQTHEKAYDKSCETIDKTSDTDIKVAGFCCLGITR